ncbi:MAG: hypothetical protein RL477_1224 [Pseudomonadota bacterium]|jgi:Spx/MgsR family transcriptional regulator
MITLYGIKTCDTCRAALKWLDQKGIAHRFHDLRADGLAAKQVAAWIAALGWETVINRRSTTWRAIPAKVREGLDAKSAAALALGEPTLIKRPLIEADGKVLVGFDAKVKAALENARG